jgi:hypothetical protein
MIRAQPFDIVCRTGATYYTTWSPKSQPGIALPERGIVTASKSTRIFVAYEGEGPPSVKDMTLAFTYEEVVPNQPPLQTPVSGMPAAGAPVAPPPGIAGP